MSDDAMPITLVEIPEPLVSGSHASARVSYGRVFVPQQQILLYSPNEWEQFTQEWVHSQKANYEKVLKLTGANDMGIDIAGLTDAAGLFGVWDNFQCKHYKDPLTPTTAHLEIGKILWYSFNGHYIPPRKYYFIAPQDCGLKLSKLLSNSVSLKASLKENWDKHCAEKITETAVISLTGEFEEYVDRFNFSIFSSRSTLEIIDEHRTTSWYAIRFGGGLPDRPTVKAPPSEIADSESRYVSQLFEAYTDNKKEELLNLLSIEPFSNLTKHFHQQREVFYNAEALRNFARDTVPPGTFEDLQNEVYAGVVDIQSGDHPDALVRLNSVTSAASNLQLTSNALISVVKIQDRKGICHQLANEDRLIWKKV